MTQIRSNFRLSRVALLVILLLGMFAIVLTVSADPWPENHNEWSDNQATTTNNSQNQWNQSAGITTITVNNSVILPGAQLLGVNIGYYDQFAAAQYLKNVVPNPGFESGEFAMIFLADRLAKPNRVQPRNWQPPWNAQQQGFWDGAYYEILSGPAKGVTGTIRQFQREGGKYTFYLNGNSKQINERDAIMVRRNDVPGYYNETPTKFFEPEPFQSRPGSPGTQSLRIKPSGWQPGYMMPFDSFARDMVQTAGKMRLIDGNWHFEFWVKADKPNTQVEVKFYRVREVEFYKEVFNVSTTWQKIERPFSIPVGMDDPTTIAPAQFEIRIAKGDGDILVDDLELMSDDHRNPTAFTDNFVNELRELKPGVIRNWGEQLGSSLDNQLSVEWARKTNGFDPYESGPYQYHYSLHEFLELAKYIGSEPWYVIPPTFTPAELRNLVAYLSAPAGSHPYANIRAQQGQSQPWTQVFGEIHLEYGNEMWGGNSGGDPFRGATLWDGYHVGQVANDRLSIMTNAPYFNDSKLNLIIGGQAGFAGRQMEIESSSSNHDAIGIAPYYASHITSFGSPEQLFYPAFAKAAQMVNEGGRIYDSRNFVDASRRGTDLVIYEINSHWTHGYVPVHTRNDFLTSLGSGLIMPLHMLTFQRDAGIRDQAAFTALQHSFQMPGRGRERASLWGMMVDVEANQVKRPTWLGVEAANRAIQGDIITTYQSGVNPTYRQQPFNEINQVMDLNLIQSFAFRQWNNYSMVLFNLDIRNSHTVKLDFPTNVNSQGTLHILTSDNIYDDNENGVNVELVTRSLSIFDGMTIELPAHSMYVIEWQSK